MGKGLETRIVFFILAVIFFALAIFVIFKIFPSLMTQIEMSLGIIKLSNIEKAALCSMYRCLIGCSAGHELEKIEWVEEDRKVVNCNDFCRGEPYGIEELPKSAYSNMNNLAICDLKSLEYPIKIKVKEGEKLTKSHLVLGIPEMRDVNCMLSVDIKSVNSNIASMTGEWLLMKVILELAFTPIMGLINLWNNLINCQTTDNWLFIDSTAIKSLGKGEECRPTATNDIVVKGSLPEVVMKKGELMIVSETHSFGCVYTISTLIATPENYREMLEKAFLPLCRRKVYGYCVGRIIGGNPNWEDSYPYNCEEIGITEPTLDECKKKCREEGWEWKIPPLAGRCG